MPDRTIKLNVIGDASGANKALDDVAGKSETTAGRAQAAFSKMYSSLGASGVLGPFTEQMHQLESVIGQVTERSSKKFGMMLMGAGGATLAGGGILTQMAAQDVQAGAQLRAAIEQTGASYSDYKERIDKVSKAQLDFAHDDADAVDAIRILTTATGDAGTAMDRMQLVSDLAAAKHIGLAEAANSVAKAHGGSARIFKEFGIVVGENADGTKNYDGALDVLAQKLQGQAAASVEGFSGHLRVLKAHLIDGLETLGEKYGPALMGVGSVMTAVGGITEIYIGIKARKTVAEVADTVATEANTVAEVENAAATRTVSLGAAGVGIAAAAAVVGLYAFGQSLNKTSLDAKELDDILKLSGDQMIAKMDSVAAVSKGPFAHAFDDALKGLAEKGPAGIGVLTQLRDHYAAIGDQEHLGKVDAALAAAAQSQNNLTTNQAEGNQVMDGGTATIKEQTAALAAAKQARDALVSSTEASFTTQRSFESSLQGVTDALQRVTDAEQGVADAKAALDKAMEPATAEDLGKAQLGVQDAHLRAADAAQRVKDAERTLGLTRLDHKKTIDDVHTAERALSQAKIDAQRATYGETDAERALQTVQQKGTEQDAAVTSARKAVESATTAVSTAQRGVNDAYIAEADAIAKHTEAVQKAAGYTWDAASSTRAQRDALAQVRDMIAPGNPLRQYLDAYIDRLDQLNSIFGALPPAFAETHNVADLGGAANAEFHGRAAGGPVSAGMAYVVGERRPEVFVPSVNGTIIPRIPNGGGGGGGTETIVLQVDGRELTRIVRQRLISDNGRNFVQSGLG